MSFVIYRRILNQLFVYIHIALHELCEFFVAIPPDLWCKSGIRDQLFCVIVKVVERDIMYILVDLQPAIR